MNKNNKKYKCSDLTSDAAELHEFVVQHTILAVIPLNVLLGLIHSFADAHE